MICPQDPYNMMMLYSPELGLLDLRPCLSDWQDLSPPASDGTREAEGAALGFLPDSTLWLRECPQRTAPVSLQLEAY